MKLALSNGLAALLVCSILAGEGRAHLPEQAKLLPSDGIAGDLFGTGVAIDGSIAIVGAPLHRVNGVRGAVYVFQRVSNTNWPEVAKLLPSGTPGPQDMFGSRVALGSGVIAVAAPRANSETGAVYIFTGGGATWAQTQVLTASDAGPNQGFGNSLAIDGDTLVIGSVGHDSAYVFRLVSGSWTEEQKLNRTGAVTGEQFGNSVGIYGEEIVVGAPGDDTDAVDAGSVYLFERSGTVWSQMQRFGSATPGAGDGFGTGACIGSEFVGIGAPFDDDDGIDAGVGHYFRRDGLGGWISEGTLTSISAPVDGGDHVGEQILVDTNLFMISQPNGDLQGTGSGGVQTFIERTSGFSGDVMFPSDTTDGDELGTSIGMKGCWMISGAPLDDDLGLNSGSAYIFLGTPLTSFYCLPGISAKGCAATLSVAGTPSASETAGFTVTADGVEGGITGVFFYGTNGQQMNPWGNGTSFQCVVPPVIRMGAITSTGSGTCTGQFNMDLNATWCPTCPKPTKNPGPGAEIYLQLWYRDPQNTSNQTTAFSNAAQIGVCP